MAAYFLDRHQLRLANKRRSCVLSYARTGEARKCVVSLRDVEGVEQLVTPGGLGIARDPKKQAASILTDEEYNFALELAGILGPGHEETRQVRQAMDGDDREAVKWACARIARELFCRRDPRNGDVTHRWLEIFGEER